ncbi:MAG TPA: hypothetical protein PKN87_10180 [Syntrophomonadaceae bacterium]|nr:hypothetical protein [Syntrophomonadaceae bacterium]HPR94314.1 hypothetical protein [Syntrophomonadaceae bacterium]
MECTNCRHYDGEKETACTNIWISEAVKQELLGHSGQGCTYFIAKDSYRNINFDKINIPAFNLTAVIIKLMAWTVLIGGLVYGAKMGKSFGEFSWAVAGLNWAVTFTAAMFLFGFGEIIRLLASIDRKLTGRSEE